MRGVDGNDRLAIDQNRLGDGAAERGGLLAQVLFDPVIEIEFPLAVVVVGGLLTSTLLNLFVVPPLYLRFGRGTAGLPENPAESEPAASLS